MSATKLLRDRAAELTLLADAAQLNGYERARELLLNKAAATLREAEQLEALLGLSTWSKVEVLKV